MASNDQISAGKLLKMFQEFITHRDDVSANEVRALKDFCVITENDTTVLSNCTLLEEYNKSDPEQKVMVINGRLTKIAVGQKSLTVNAPAPQSRMERVIVDRSQETLIKDQAAIMNSVKRQSYKVDLARLKESLEGFISTITLEDEAYQQGDLKIFHFGDRNADVTVLIAAGTKVLDALMFVSMKDDEANSGLFVETKLTDGISEREIVENVREAKRAIQAGIVLVYVQGSLPSKTREGRKVPNFIISKLYDGVDVSMDLIAGNLSCVSTVKFPGKILLNMNIDLLPGPVSSRCKLNVAGNRAIRYAVFASMFEEASEREITDEVPRTSIALVMEVNKKIQLAKGIKKTLSSLDGSYKNQLVMHPLSENKPSIKNFTLKLTCAIIFSMSKKGRMNMAAKILSDKNEAFKRDANFFGSGEGEDREWEITRNGDADFSGLSVEGLKLIYKIA